jgi:hypothetical protein
MSYNFNNVTRETYETLKRKRIDKLEMEVANLKNHISNFSKDKIIF